MSRNLTNELSDPNIRILNGWFHLDKNFKLKKYMDNFTTSLVNGDLILNLTSCPVFNETLGGINIMTFSGKLILIFFFKSKISFVFFKNIHLIIKHKTKYQT